jgi:hypothetical protein
MINFDSLLSEIYIQKSFSLIENIIIQIGKILPGNIESSAIGILILN